MIKCSVCMFRTLGRAIEGEESGNSDSESIDVQGKFDGELGRSDISLLPH